MHAPLATRVTRALDLRDPTVSAPMVFAAGGVLAAALMLGADGVLVGTRLRASREALVPPAHHRALLGTDGDGTLRTTLPDIARQLPWPRGFTTRIRHNAFVECWKGREAEFAAAIEVEGPRYREAFLAGDPDDTAVWFGEAAGLIDAIEPAGVIVERIATQAAARLSAGTSIAAAPPAPRPPRA